MLILLLLIQASSSFGDAFSYFADSVSFSDSIVVATTKEAGATAEIVEEAVVSAVAPASIVVATTKEDGATAEIVEKAVVSAVALASIVVATIKESGATA